MRPYSLSLLVVFVLCSSACVRREFESQLGEIGDDNRGGGVSAGGSLGEMGSSGEGGTSRGEAGVDAGRSGAGRSNGGRAGAPRAGTTAAPEGGAGASNGGAAGTLIAGVAGESKAGALSAVVGGDGGARDGGAAGSSAARRGEAGGHVPVGGEGGRVPECVPTSEICNGIDDDCDSLVDLDDVDSGLEFDFSAFREIASDVAAPAYLDAVFAETAGRYGVLWAPALSQADETPSARLYILNETGELQGYYVEIPEIAPVPEMTRRPRLASNGSEFGIVWSWSADSEGVRLLVVDAVERSRVGSIVELDELDTAGSSITSDGSAWYVAGGRPYSMPQPIWIARLVTGEVARSIQLDAEGVWPVLAAAGSTVGVTWARDTDEDIYYADEIRFSYGQSLDELADEGRFGARSESISQAGLMSASASHFTIVPAYPGSLIQRLDAEGKEVCRAVWPEGVSTAHYQLASSEAGSVAIAKLPGEAGTQLGVVRITNDCQVEGALPIFLASDSNSLELAAAVGSSGAILVRSDGDLLRIARATNTWCVAH